MKSRMPSVEKAIEVAALPPNEEIELATQRLHDSQQLGNVKVAGLASLESRNAGLGHVGSRGQINLTRAFLDS